VSEPKSIKDLYSLASQVAESRAIDDWRKVFEHYAPPVNPPQGKRDIRPVSVSVGETRQSLSRAVDVGSVLEMVILARIAHLQSLMSLEIREMKEALGSE
jgi:hypothetical protein